MPLFDGTDFLIFCLLAGENRLLMGILTATGGVGILLAHRVKVDIRYWAKQKLLDGRRASRRRRYYRPSHSSTVALQV